MVACSRKPGSGKADGHRWMPRALWSASLGPSPLQGSGLSMNEPDSKTTVAPEQLQTVLVLQCPRHAQAPMHVSPDTL